MRKLWSDCGGNFGLITGLLILPLLGAAGLAIDFTRATVAKTQLQVAADAAALGAITSNSKAFNQAIQSDVNGTYTLSPQEAQDIFLSQIPPGNTILDVNATISIEKQAGQITSNLQFSGEVPTSFMGALGLKTVLISGTASAKTETPKFLDIRFLLDTSPSMGLGATAQDQAIIKNVTRNLEWDGNCEFACHIISYEGVEKADSHYNLARQAGAKVRIDVAAEALSKVVTIVEKLQFSSQQVRLAAYSFGSVATLPGTLPLKTIVNPTLNFDSFRTSVANIKLMTVPYWGYPQGQSDYNFMISEAGKKISSVGTGKTLSSREPVLILIGDGLSHHPNTANCTGRFVEAGRCMEPVRKNVCDAIRQRGIKIGVIYTPYLPLYSSPGYNDFIRPWEAAIPNQMKACATDGLYVEAGEGDGIKDALDTVLKRILSTPRLTN